MTSSLPTASDLVAQQEPLLAAHISGAAQAWQSERVRRFETLVRRIPKDLLPLLTELLEAKSEEATLKGLNMGLQRAQKDSRSTNREQHLAQMKAGAERRAQTTAQNTVQGKQLEQAARENRALRIRADTAEKELLALKASLSGLERVIRWKIIVGAPADHRPLPRLAPRSGLFHRHLSHGPQIRRVARRIEELMAAHPYRGSANRSQLEEQLLPETPAKVFDHALTHLLLSRRLAQSRSGVYRLRGSAPPGP